MDVKLTQTPDAFDLPEWRTLLEADPHRHIFATPEWHQAWWEEFGESKELYVLTFLDPEPVGLAALTLDETPDGRRLRFVGGDDLTDYLGPLADGHEHHPGIADSLMTFIRDEITEWDYFLARCLPVPFHFADWLVEAADRHGLDYRVRQDEMTLVLALPESLDEYLEGLRARDRHELRRKLRRLEQRLPDAVVEAASKETLEADVGAFVDLHKGSEGLKGKFMVPGRATFFSRLAAAFEPMGALRLDFLRTGGRTVATTFSFEYDGVFYLYNAAYDRDVRDLSPGLVLISKLIERSIDLGHRRFDFLRGQERYKYELGGEPLPLQSVRIAR